MYNLEIAFIRFPSFVLVLDALLDTEKSSKSKSLLFFVLLFTFFAKIKG